jgi:hypothetical protein
MLPDSSLQGEELLRLVMFGHLHFQSLWAGVELGVFEVLSGKGPRTLDELTDDLDLAPQPVKMVMANLVALGLVEQRGAAFGNSQLSRRFLLASSEHSAVHVIRWQARIVYQGVDEYVRALRENRNVGLERFSGPGATLYERLVAHPDLEKIFQDAMASMPSNAFLADHIPLDGLRHLCDCGGGNGRNALDLAGRHRDLRVTVFDQPSVCAKARANIAASGLGARVSTHEGNFLTDAFPPGIDGILYSHIGSIWSKQTNVAVFRRAREALAPGGRLFIYNMVANDAHSGPLSVTCGSVYFHALATGEGFMHSQSEYGAMLLEAGFGTVSTVSGLPVSHALVVGTK